MPEFELSPHAQQWLGVLLIWIGFGTLAGLLAKVVLPPGRPGGAIPTVVLGTVGSAIGLAALSYFGAGRPLNPIGPLGFLAATAGAFSLLIACRAIYACAGRRGQRDGP